MVRSAPIFSGHSQSVGIDVYGNSAAAVYLGDGYPAQPHRSGAEDCHRQAFFYIPAVPERMQANPHGLGNGGMLKGYMVRDPYGIHGREPGILGVTAVGVKPQYQFFLAETGVPCSAKVAPAAGDIGLGAHPVPGLQRCHVPAEIGHDPGKFMPQHPGEGSQKVVALEAVNVRTAYPAGRDPDHNVIGARLGGRYLVDADYVGTVYYCRFHPFLPPRFSN